MDLREDEEAYQKMLGVAPNRLDYGQKKGQALELTMRDPADYYAWRENNNGKCYPVFYPDGKYTALQSLTASSSRSVR